MENFNQLLLDLAASQNYVEEPADDDVTFSGYEDDTEDLFLIKATKIR